MNKEIKNKNPKIKQEGNKVGTRTPKLDKKEFQVWYIDYYFYKECRTLRMVTVQNGKKTPKWDKNRKKLETKRNKNPKVKQEWDKVGQNGNNLVTKPSLFQGY